LEGGYNPSTWQRDPAAYPTVIDATGLKSWGSVIKLNWANDISIDGFSIKGTQDYGIFVYGGEGIKIKNCIVRDMRKAGIYTDSWAGISHELTIDHCRISENEIGVEVRYNPLSLLNSEISNNRKTGVFVSDIGELSRIANCRIMNNFDAGIGINNTTDKLVIKNNLIVYNGGGIIASGNASPVVLSNTIAYSKLGAGFMGNEFLNGPKLSPILKHNIICNNVHGGITLTGNLDIPSAAYSDYNDVWNNGSIDYQRCNKGVHDISADPLFVSGSKGEYYLSQLSAGQQVDSPCVGAGSTTAAEAGLADYVTNSNYLRDTGTLDIGFHYPAPIARILANPAAVNGVISGRSTLGVQFYGDSSQGEIASYLWNFGNGATARIANPSQTFVNNSRSAKAYTVSLTVVDRDGVSATSSVQVRLKPKAMWFGLGGD
jgi:hypothetical protein